MRIRRPDSLKDGILIGLAPGAASGAFLAFLEESAPPSPDCWIFCDRMPGMAAVGGAVLGGAVGIGVGAVVDAFRRQQRLIYERPPKSGPSVSIAPLVGRRSAGLAVRVRM